MTTDYNKTDRLSPTTRKLTGLTEDTESAFAETTTPTNIHQHNILKGKMHSNYSLLPDHIVCKITQRNNIRGANTCDPALKLLNEEIASEKQNLSNEHLDVHWDHRQNTHILWKTIHGLSNRESLSTLNTAITFNNKIATTPKYIANCFIKQFTNTVKHTRQTDTPIEKRIKYKDIT